nr:uncharacterized protein LOC119178398 [Rhipicephalus microplus]
MTDNARTSSPASTAAETINGTPPNPRVTWSENDTWVLIRIWEDHLPELRGEKHNARVYDAIVAALAKIGILRTRRQVQNKIDNLTQKYRKEAREKTTGSAPSVWPFFVELRRFLGYVYDIAQMSMRLFGARRLGQVCPQVKTGLLRVAPRQMPAAVPRTSSRNPSLAPAPARASHMGSVEHKRESGCPPMKNFRVRCLNSKRSLLQHWRLPRKLSRVCVNGRWQHRKNLWTCFRNISINKFL